VTSSVAIARRGLLRGAAATNSSACGLGNAVGLTSIVDKRQFFQSIECFRFFVFPVRILAIALSGDGVVVLCNNFIEIIILFN